MFITIRNLAQQFSFFSTQKCNMRGICLFLLLISLITRTRCVEATTRTPLCAETSLTVILNGISAGEYPVRVAEDQDILMRWESVAALGMDEFQAAMTEDGFVSLASLAPDFTFIVDWDQAILRGEARPWLLAQSAEQSPPILTLASDSAETEHDPAQITEAQEFDTTDHAQRILKFIVNSVETGYYPVRIADDQDIWMSWENVVGLGIVIFPKQCVITEEGFVSLTSLAPDFTFTVDWDQAILRGNASPSLFAQPTAQEQEQIILNVIVNEANAGDYLVWMTAQKDILMNADDVAALGLVNLPKQAARAEDGTVSLSSLAPDFTFTIDWQQAILHGDADPSLFAKQLLDYQPQRPADIDVPQGNFAFLNYQISYNADADGEIKTFETPVEAVARIGDYIAQSSVLYTQTRAKENVGGNEEHLTRMFTTVVRDDPDKQRRYLFGDTTTSMLGMSGGNLPIGGFSISKEFEMTPYFQKSPEVTVSGVAQTPSTVEIYLNDQLFRKEKLPPGAFDVENLPLYGIGNATLIITDAFGRTQEVTTPFHLSSNLLKPGLHDYRYVVGFKREDIEEEHFKYTDLVISARHQMGMTPSFTLAGVGEADHDTVSLGTTAVWLPTQTGEMNLATALSYDDHDVGYALSARYQMTLGALSGNFWTQFLSETYANLKIDASDSDKLRWQTAGNLSFSDKKFGSFSLGAALSERHSGIASNIENLSYSRTLSKRFRFSASISRFEEDDQETEFRYLTGIYFLPGPQHPSANIEYQNANDKGNTTARIQQTPLHGRGFGYQAMLGHDDEGETIGDAAARYLGQYAETNVRYYRNADDRSGGEATLSGALTLANRHVYFSRSITDSFAIVQVGDVPGMLVQSGGQTLGVTNRRGEIFASNLISYYDNLLSLDPKQAPINYELLESKKYVSPQYRSGGVIEFDVRKLQTYEGTLIIETKDGQQKPAEFGWLTFIVDGSAVESVIGTGGLIYLENMPSGQFPAEIALENESCHFTLTIPESNEFVVDLGKVICKMN